MSKWLDISHATNTTVNNAIIAKNISDLNDEDNFDNNGNFGKQGNVNPKSIVLCLAKHEYLPHYSYEERNTHLLGRIEFFQKNHNLDYNLAEKQAFDEHRQVKHIHNLPPSYKIGVCHLCKNDILEEHMIAAVGNQIFHFSCYPSKTNNQKKTNEQDQK